MKTLYAVTQRPDDSISYSPGDVIGHLESNPNAKFKKGYLTFEGNGPIASIGLVTIYENTAQPVLPQLELWLFKTPPKDQDDNTPLAVPDREFERYFVAAIPLSKSISARPGASCVHQSDGREIRIEPVARLFGYLVVRNKYTPAPKEQFMVKIFAAD